MGGEKRGVRSRIPKVAGSGRNKKKITRHCVIFCNLTKGQTAGDNKTRVGTGIKGYRKWEAKLPPCLPELRLRGMGSGWFGPLVPHPPPPTPPH